MEHLNNAPPGDIVFLTIAFLGACGIPILRSQLRKTNLYKNGATLGPNQWGWYHDSSGTDSPSERRIVPGRPARVDNIPIGWQR